MTAGSTAPGGDTATIEVSLIFSIALNLFIVTQIINSQVRNISHLPDTILLEIFKYLRLRDLCRFAVVCKKWRSLAYDGRLWSRVSLRPEYNGLQVSCQEALLAIINHRAGASLRYVELPADFITPSVLHELANK